MLPVRVQFEGRKKRQPTTEEADKIARADALRDALILVDVYEKFSSDGADGYTRPAIGKSSASMAICWTRKTTTTKTKGPTRTAARGAPGPSSLLFLLDKPDNGVTLRGHTDNEHGRRVGRSSGETQSLLSVLGENSVDNDDVGGSGDFSSLFDETKDASPHMTLLATEDIIDDELHG